ncbi:MAG: hypothetical protein WB622_07215 [Acidobacteriaceae bacterium]
MRRVTINPHDPTSALQEIQTASSENDLVDIANSFTMTGTLTETTNLNLSSPTAANLAAVLGTLLSIMQRGGLNRTG